MTLPSRFLFRSLFRPRPLFRGPSWLAGMLCCALLSGCSAVETKTVMTAQNPLLSPVKRSLEAVQLDIVYVERDEKDPLLTRMLWEEIDQVGTVDLQTRSRLREAGFRVGLVGMTPPRSLQRLLGMHLELTDAACTSRHRELAGRSVLLRSGGDTEIQTSPTYYETSLKLPGETEPTVFKNARFVVRAELERLQDGWVNLHLSPEIHHGNSQLRPVAGQGSWQYKGAQEVQMFHDLKFSVPMNIGEMVILSSDVKADQSVGDRFFVNRDEQRPQRRLVVIRLTDMKKIEPLYSE